MRTTTRKQRVRVRAVSAAILLAGALCHAAAAAAADDDDDVSCGLYLAPSTLSSDDDDNDAGLGIFTATERQPGDVLEGTADTCLPWIDLMWHQPDRSSRASGGGGNNGPYVADYYWHGRALGMGTESKTGTVEASCPGLWSLLNCHAVGANVHAFQPTYDDHQQQHARHDAVAVGAASPYGVRSTTVSRPVPAGGELLTFYGPAWWMGNLPATRVDDAALDDDAKLSWRCLRSSDGEDVHARSPSWLRRHGRCVDRIVSGRSTLVNGGRGALARCDMPEGTIITTSPLHHFVNDELFEMYNITKHKKRYPVPQSAEEEEDEESEEGEDDDDDFSQGFHYRRHIDDVLQHQIAINYCFGNAQTTLLLCPYGVGVNYLNHNKDDANVRIRWAEDFDWHDPNVVDTVTLDDLAAMPPTLAFDYVATRDIAAGEELFLDYGGEWERAWEDHQETFFETTRSATYASAHQWNRRFANAPIRTDEEQELDPYPEHIEVRCHYDLAGPSDGSSSSTSTGSSSSNYTWKSEDLGYPCTIVDRFFDRGEWLYTLDVEAWPEPGYDNVRPHVESIQVTLQTDIPRRALRFFDVPGTSDLHLHGTFRHYITFPDEMLPDQWIVEEFDEDEEDEDEEYMEEEEDEE